MYSYIYLAGVNKEFFNRIMSMGCNVQRQINFLNKIKKCHFLTTAR